MKKIIFLLLVMMLVFDASMAKPHRFTLVIDAGHGGKDAGACAFGGKEKNINLDVALAFGRYVERNCSDVKVIYTRKTDVFVPLHERADIANRNKADVFISIHTNAVSSKRPITGLETYTMGIRRSDEKLSAAKRENEVVLIEDNYKQHYAGFDPRSPESMIIFEFINEDNMAKSVELAQLIQRNVSSTANRPNKGVRQDAFLVLRETSMPACLVELGYITTRSEKNYLTNKNNVELMGQGLYKAFVAYKNRQTGSRQKASVEVPAQQVEEKEPVAQPVKEPVAQPVKEPVAEPVAVADSQPSEKQDETVTEARPVFKVQILTSDKQLRNGDSRLKGVKNTDSYKEGRLWKYTAGTSENYNEIYQLRKQLLNKFPQAFIVAFRSGQKVDVNEAIREFKNNKRK